MQAHEPKTAVVRDEVTAWRLRELLRAGYEWDDAVELATRHTIDTRLARGLLVRGCPPQLALRILL
jgi:hypothetical protein